MAKRLDLIRVFDPVQSDLVRQATKATEHVPTIAATSAVPPTVIPAPPPAPPKVSIGLGQPVTHQALRSAGIAKRFLMTRDEDAEFSAFLSRLETRCKRKIGVSGYIRAAICFLASFEEAIAEELEATAPPRLPSNHDAVAMSMYEEWCTQCLAQAIRKRHGIPKSNQ